MGTLKKQDGADFFWKFGYRDVFIGRQKYLNGGVMIVKHKINFHGMRSCSTDKLKSFLTQSVVEIEHKTIFTVFVTSMSVDEPDLSSSDFF